MKNSTQRFCLGFLVIFLIGILSVSVAAVDQTSAKLVSNVFDNTYLIDALRDVSAQTGVAIIADSTVTGQITVTLENTPLEEALDMLLAPGGYVFRKLNGYYLVGAPDIKNPSFALLSRTEMVKLRYVKAETALAALAEPFKQFAKADKDNNSIVLTAPDNIIKRLHNDLTIIDRQMPQIMMEALVVDVSKTGRKDLGLDWSWEDNIQNNTDISKNNYLQVVDLATGYGFINDGGTNKFMFNLKAVIEKGNARVEANPRVATLDGQTAEIFVGRERYYELVTTDNDETDSEIESIKTGISLKLVPQIADNGEIILRVEPEVSDAYSESTTTSNLPVINRRKIATTIRVKDGESVVLGGLIQRTNQKVKKKVPVLGDIPILGLLFQSVVNQEEEGEVLIIITARLMRNGTGVDSASLKVLNEPLIKEGTRKEGQ